MEQHLTQAAFTQKFTMLDSVLMQQEYHVLFSSVHLDFITQEMLHPNTEEVFMQVLGPICG